MGKIKFKGMLIWVQNTKRFMQKVNLKKCMENTYYGKTMHVV